MFTAVALYTPVFQAMALYLFLYRGDLLRFRHPLREKRGLAAWVDVLTQLGLINEKIEVSGGRRGMVATRLVGRLLVPTAVLSLLGAYLLAPFLLETIPLLARFESPLLFFIQLIPSMYFLLLAQGDYLGPLPVSPERQILPPKHRSSLIRHLEEL